MEIIILRKIKGYYVEFPLTYPLKRTRNRGLVAAVPAPGNSGILAFCPRIKLIAVRLIFERPGHDEYVGGKSTRSSRHQEEPAALVCCRGVLCGPGLRSLNLLQYIRRKVGLLDCDVVTGLLGDCENNACYDRQNEHCDSQFLHYSFLSPFKVQFDSIQVPYLDFTPS